MSFTIQLNGQPRHFEHALTVADLLVHEGILGKRVAVERNGEIVTRSAHASTHLQAGDKVEIVQAMGGG